MKAAVIHKFGHVDELKYEDIETPMPKPGHILIKVLAAGINRLDHYIREGSVAPELPFPHILGADAAGEVAELGEGVTGFEIGQRVVPLSGYPLDEKDYEIYPNSAAPSYVVTGLHTPGTYAQYIQVPARWVLKDDTGLRPEEVATLPVVAVTGSRALRVVGQVKAGDKVLITAGSSGVGTFQVQAAKALGAEVAATVRSDAKGEIVKRLGANLIINTSRENLVKQVMDWTDGRGADVVIDNVGGNVLPQAIDAAKVQGIIVAIGFVAGTEVTLDIRNFFFGQKQLRGSLAGDKTDFEWALEQVRTGRIRPLLDRTLPLSHAAEAHRLISTNKVTGNIVLLPWSE
jgi:NADPH:quinone reductase-like Zn-dependent oxidoreductase